jgi:hypothetical protein
VLERKKSEGREPVSRTNDLDFTTETVDDAWLRHEWNRGQSVLASLKPTIDQRPGSSMDLPGIASGL